ncbi:MAG: MBL fold metallo-hydrolase [Bacteroidetes bacterium]|nr:MBL fold metallo-hydrolase [Bacteroidota bacterium]
MKNKDLNISFRFLGAAGTVTGSKTLVTFPDYSLMVDCGLFQGLKHLREMNWEDLDQEALNASCIILTHGHLDHVGYLPRMVRQGFKGKVYCSQPTADLAAIILEDSARIQEEDAEHANRHGYSKHDPALPLYDQKDAKRAIALLQPVDVNEWFRLTDDLRIRFRMNSHILGATFVELDYRDTLIVFSGDTGRPFDPILGPPERPSRADFLIIESTYGDRNHPNDDTEEQLERIIKESAGSGGTLLIPSFTVDRAQDFLYFFWNLKKNNRIPDIPVYLDSPMGIDVSKLFIDYPSWRKLEHRAFREAFSHTRMVHSINETEALTRDNRPKIIVAGSGMMNGGRILHYLEQHLGNPASTILICGYQAEGTRGRLLKDGAKELKIHGRFYEVKARVAEIRTMSSHADQNELMEWISLIKNKPRAVFINHGEPQSANALRVKINHEKHWNCAVPRIGDVFAF